MSIAEQAVKNMTGEVLVELAGAGVLRSGRWLVRNVDLCVRRGEIVTIIGPNGSGKSTTAKLIVGATLPDEGELKSVAGLSIGYVPQRLSINPSMPLTCERLLALSAGKFGANISQVLKLVGADHLHHAQVQQLSGGEFQRVLLARAMLARPDLLVLDEPVAGVDFSGSIELYRLISKIRDETGCGVLLISHDLHVVMAQTDVVVCMNQHVCCTGAPEAIAENPEYLKLFGAGTDLAIYSHKHDHVHLDDGTVCDHNHDDQSGDGDKNVR